ncbi:MAG: hypothetical protein QOH81_3025, partial [Sphingomonadales bacterium]|nr:hypothetical protein [Sphingomonadales bacterium]
MRSMVEGASHLAPGPSTALRAVPLPVPGRSVYPMVGMTNAFSPVAEPSGQRWVTVLVLVQNLTPSMPCWLMSPKP